MRKIVWSTILAVTMIAVGITQGADLHIALDSYDQATFSGSSVYYSDDNLSADGNFLIGVIGYGPREISIDDGSVVNGYDNTADGTAKSAIQLGAYIFFTGASGEGLARLDSSWSSRTAYVNPTNALGVGSLCESIATDGTLVFGNDDNYQTNIHAWAISNGATDFTADLQWTATIPGTSTARIRAFSYDASGYIYVCGNGNGNADDRDVYAIRVSDQSVIDMGIDVPGTDKGYGIVREGNTLIALTRSAIYVWNLTSSTSADPASVDTYTSAQLSGGASMYSLSYSEGRLLIGWVANTRVFDAAPRVPALLSGELALQRTMTMSAGSIYNPRMCGEDVYGVDISAPGSVNRYAPGSTTPDASKDLGALPSRMLSPMGGNSTNWVIASGSSEGGNDYFKRFDYATMANETNAMNDVGDLEPNSFDWVDSDTLISVSYQIRNRIYLFDVVADPFSTTSNTSWNANGYVDAAAGIRMRNIRVGDWYNGYAYFADSLVVDPTIYAIDLATGVITSIGTGAFTDVGGYADGAWQCQEVEGYMYLQTTSDGIYVYDMTDATTLGTLYTHHTQAQLQAAAGVAASSYGSDVADSGRTIIWGRSSTAVAELGESRLPFMENFESDYTDGDAISDYHGWTGNSACVATSTAAITGSLGGYVPSDNAITNEFLSGSLERVWTDMNVVITMWTDATAPTLDTSATAQFYVNSNGYPVVADGSTWVTKTTTPAGDAITPYASGAARATMFNNYSNHTWAICLDGVLIAEQIDFADSSVDSYTRFSVNGEAEFDDLTISETTPNLTGDQDNDGLIDVWEVQYFNSITAYSGSDDPDGDGASNARELEYGTDPTNPNSTPPANGTWLIM